MSQVSSYTKSIIKRLFTALDLSNQATTDKEMEDVNKFIEKINVELKGFYMCYEGKELKYSNQLDSVIHKLTGLETVTDYNVRKSIFFDCIGVLDKIAKNN